VTDFVVIGGGMAGVSAAAHLAPLGSVTLLEMERTLAYHTTGRSAALFVVNYGAHGVRPLARASRRFLESPPEGSTEAPLLTPRGLLWIGEAAQVDQIEQIAAGSIGGGEGSRLVGPEEMWGLVPALRRERIAGGVYEPGASDIDVAALHQAFVRIARRHGAEIRPGAGVTAIERSGSGWAVRTGQGEIRAQAVVDAAGAWGDVVAVMAGVEPIGLQPMRRTAFMVPGNEEFASWPMVVDAEQRFYFKPDGVQLLCSLAEEIPSDPTDARPRMEDVAMAIERINEATTLEIAVVNSEWAGLRTFAPDRELVIGEDPTASGFFWLVGQGGVGIQTSPGYGSLLASLATGGDLSPDLVEAGVDPALTDPARFRR
jgi:D-arginine dehydrogenase